MNKEKRTILFITERRADYSRLKPIMREVRKSKKLEMKLVVTGMHLLAGFGETRKQIERDGFKIDALLPIFTPRDKDDGASMARAMGKALLGFSELFPKIKPDIEFTGFDLGANLAAAITAMHLNIHVAHIQGGEVSGTVDEVLRHAITKFSHLHFAATKKSRERIIRLGENPKCVFWVGSPSLDTIKNISYPRANKILKQYGLDAGKKLIILLQHPVTTEVDDVVRQIKQTIAAVKKINAKHNTQALAIYSNNDAGGKRIVNELKKSGIKVFAHIPYEDFLRLMKVSAVLVGNSSSGIHEAPSFGLPTVNIGTRQQFRERGVNVIDVANREQAIAKAMEKCLNDKSFQAKAKQGRNPYEHGRTAQQVVKILENIKLPPIQKVITY